MHSAQRMLTHFTLRTRLFLAAKLYGRGILQYFEDIMAYCKHSLEELISGLQDKARSRPVTKGIVAKMFRASG